MIDAKTIGILPACTGITRRIWKTTGKISAAREDNPELKELVVER